ncbi:MAG TPA: putative quinol monooxygenase [Roseateles sp.]|nr:putative quinol monooxygenase [Roseateles sp.]
MSPEQFQPPVTVVISCAILPDKLDMARRELQAVIGQVMAKEPACRGIRVHEAADAPHRWLIVEQWASREAFTGPHLQQPHMQAFMQAAPAFLDGQADFGFWHETFSA